ncbi:calcium-binding protein [Planktotalea sp.]|uniref:calcium-binding protein n=1 Tax=Planktotalea sp. TaxID=2029877 RepID=UPI003D6BE3D0
MAFGPEFQVNTHWVWRQNGGDVATLNDGSFVITWQSFRQDGSDGGVFAQRYASDGTPLGGEFQVNTYTNLHQVTPSIVALAGGGFVIAWESIQGNTNYSIFAQVYNSDGTLNGGELLLDDNLAEAQRNVDLEALPNGGFVATWETSYIGSSDSVLHVKLFDAAGTGTTNEIMVRSSALEGDYEGDIQVLPDGSFYVFWRKYTSFADNRDIYGRHFDAAGVATAPEFRVNDHVAHFQAHPASTLLNDGGVVVMWTSMQGNGSHDGVFAKIYNADGTQRIAEIQLHQIANEDEFAVEIVALDNGGFAAIWIGTGYADNNDVILRTFDANGVPTSDDILVNDFTTGSQIATSLSALSDGRLIIVYDDEYNDHDGDQNGIFARIYTPEPECNVIMGDGASNSISGTSDDDCIFGLGADDFIDGHDGDDVIEGNDGYDEITGGNGNDTLYGGRKIDQLWGDAGRDKLFGGKSLDHLRGGAGRDTLQGNEGGDTLEGGDGRDKLKGGKGFDVLFGDNGKDTLLGGKGDDILIGGAEEDQFVFQSGGGNDTIQDFDAADNAEQIKLSAVTEIVDFTDLSANHMTQVGANVVIDDGVNLTITLLNVNLVDLGNADFIF